MLPEQITASFRRASRAGLPKHVLIQFELNTQMPMFFTYEHKEGDEHEDEES